MNLTSNVPALMRERNIRTALQLKRLTGLAYSTCWDLRRGKVPSRATTIAALAKALDVQPGELFRTG